MGRRRLHIPADTHLSQMVGDYVERLGIDLPSDVEIETITFDPFRRVAGFVFSASSWDDDLPEGAELPVLRRSR